VRYITYLHRIAQYRLRLPAGAARRPVRSGPDDSMPARPPGPPGNRPAARQARPLPPGSVQPGARGREGRRPVSAGQLPARPGTELLAEAAARIGTTLDLGITAREIAGVAVPALADAAVVLVAERLLAADDTTARPDGTGLAVRRLAARVAGQPGAVTAAMLRPGEVVILGGESPGCRAMSTGRPALSGCPAPGSSRQAAQLAGRCASVLAAPLAARGTVLGCLMLGRAAGRPGFTAADAALAGELAARAAVCIDNARLYDRERRAARALQQGLLAAGPDAPPGLETASCSEPVDAGTAGGDWHDIIALPGGRAALIVGDVMGHGPEAAAVMVQLRAAAHVLAALGLPPGQVLGSLGQLAAGMPGDPYATCIAAVIDPAAGSCAVASAGHLPPVLALPGGGTRIPAMAPALPLGLGTGTPPTTRLPLPPGTTLALYTDGLVESRARSLDQGLAELRRTLASALARPAATLHGTCQAVTRSMRDRGEDDITLLLARTPAAATGGRPGQ
jgi:serine phosphatase RsbU (regulator of sigma subunit)